MSKIDNKIKKNVYLQPHRKKKQRERERRNVKRRIIGQDIGQGMNMRKER